MSRTLQTFFSTLPRQQMRIAKLFWFRNGCTQKDIAGRLGMRQNNVSAAIAIINEKAKQQPIKGRTTAFPAVSDASVREISAAMQHDAVRVRSSRKCPTCKKKLGYRGFKMNSWGQPCGICLCCRLEICDAMQRV